MSRLSVVTAAEASKALTARLGAEPGTTAGLADLVRAEVSARGSCLRSATVARVVRQVAPVVVLDTGAVGDVCDLLERAGDLQAGGRRSPLATPIRAVQLPDGAFRVFASLPSARLEALLPGAWLVVDCSRTWRPAANAEDALRGLGAALLTPAEWAGFSRTPFADAAWLASLERRLTAVPEAAGSLERDETLSWKGWSVGAEGPRWKADAAAARLWRSRDRFGYWKHAWTRQGSPQQSQFVSLRSDEGVRTTFAVARVAELPLVAMLERGEAQAFLDTPWLPAAEYRFLGLMATSGRGPDGSTRWALPLARLDAAMATLRERLGLVVRETGAI